jgi:RNA polymerase-binding transcription factor DksA
MAKKKNDGKLTPKQIEKYHQILLDKRKELLGDVECMQQNIFQSGGELSSMPMHLADIGTDNFEQEFSLGLMAEGKKVLTEIDHALRRIEDGSYGICEGLGSPIEPQRLEAIPWTRYSLEYAKKMEKGRSPGNHRLRPIDIDRQDESGADESEEEVETEDVASEAPEVDGETIELPERDDTDDFDDKEDVGEKHFNE